MSVLKIKKDIELLKQQLNELEANISDPIERIEQKKQLEREIKKLERSKSQIEKLVLEQQELELLKAEFLSKNNELLNENQSERCERCEQAEFTLESNTSLTNKSTVESEIKLDNQIKNSRNSQVSNTLSREENLDSCGDKDPGGTNIWYRVYVNDTPENLNTIHSNYCRDAIRKYRQKEQINSIEVAAFTNESKAEAFAQLLRINIGSGEVDEPSMFNKGLANINSQKSLTNSNLVHDNLNKSYEGIDESESIILINRLYNLLSQKSFDEAELLYDSQLTYQFNSNFFSQFERVTAENLRITSKTQNSIKFVGQNVYVWLDGSTQKELRSYQVKNLGGELKITASQFIKVTKFR